MKRSSLVSLRCPVGRAAGQLVDAWTFVILRELFRGNRRFEELRVRSGMSPRSLTLRLGRLVDEGVLLKVPCADAPAFHEYRLTPKGLELWPVLVMLRQWGERWTGGTRVALRHRGHDHELHAVLCCATCGEPVDARSSELIDSPAALHRAEAVATQPAEATAASEP